jgi:hypothetical protein
MPSDFTVRAQPVFWNNKKIDTLMSGTFNADNKSQSLFVNGKYVGESDGPFVGEMTLEYIQPEDPTSVNIVSDMLSKKKITMLVPLGSAGTLGVQIGHIIGGSLKWSSETGMFSGDVKLRFGDPELI